MPAKPYIIIFMLLCAAFTLAALTTAVTLYLATPETETAVRPSQL